MKWTRPFVLCLSLAGSACATPNTDSAENVLEEEPLKRNAQSAFLSRRGPQFYDGDEPVRLVGVNKYNLAGGPLAAKCQHDGDAARYAAFCQELLHSAAALGANVVRLWAFQGYAGPTGRDFTAFDHVVATARDLGIRVILTLEDNWADCSYPAGPKDAAWFSGGYKAPYGYPLSLPDYTRAIVEHFRDEPTVAMWQVLNEGKWYQDPPVLQKFLADMAQLIKSIDARHLVSGGGAIQCWQGDAAARDFELFGSGEAIDVLDAHDYGSERDAWPTCMAGALQAAKALNKPLMIGESGMDTDKGFSIAERAQLIAAKMDAAAEQGVQGYLIWALGTPADYHGSFDFLPTDPLADILRQRAPQWVKGAPEAMASALHAPAHE